MKNSSLSINQRILKLLEWTLGSLLSLMGLVLCYAGKTQIGLPYLAIGVVMLPIINLPTWIKAFVAIAGVALGLL